MHAAITATRRRRPVGQRVGRRQLAGTGEHDRRQADRDAAAQPRGDRGGAGDQAEGDHADQHRGDRPGPGRQLGAGGRGGHRSMMPWHPPHATRRSAAGGPYAVADVGGGYLPKPLLRGWMHLVCFFLAIPAGVTVVALAQSPRGRVGALVYAVGLVALFGVSGAYHRFGWSDARRLWMQKLDHGTIFLMIAGSYTPVCLMVLEGWVTLDDARDRLDRRGGGLPAGVHRRERPAGSCAARSTSGSAGRRSPPSRRCGATCRSPSSCSSRSAGCCSPSAPCSCFTRWPDPFPRVFGYHEVWHALVVAAVACHFVAITSLVVLGLRRARPLSGR